MTYYSDATVQLHHGDCLDVLRTLPDASVDAVVTDPPYDLTSGKKGGTGAASVNLDSPYGRSRIGTGNGSGGFMGKAWDSTGVAFDPETWRLVFRVLKPGGHLLAFGGTRTWHRLACAVEDAGFEVRDSIAWLYGSGFPKSLDVSKAIDKAAGAERKVVGPDPQAGRRNKATPRFTGDQYANGETWQGEPIVSITAPATDAARTWQGWGTALKPAFEPIVVARKPLSGTVAQNVLTHGTGALNVAATRIGTDSVGSSPGGSTACTCPSREADPSTRIPSTSRPGRSVAAHEGRSDLPASAQQGASDRPRPQGSLGDCLSSPRSGDAPAREAREGDQASVRPRPDAGTSPARCASCGRIRSTPSMPYADSTAPNVERAGRWPANVVLDPSQAAALDEQSGERPGFSGGGKDGAGFRSEYVGGEDKGWRKDEPAYYDDNGGASRFFYVAQRDDAPGCHCPPCPGRGDDGHGLTHCAECCFGSGVEADIDCPTHGEQQIVPRFMYTAKADASERVRVDGTAHPTVKPLALMRWLVRLVTPPGGTVLEPFAGSGTTVEACILEGFRCIAIEREADYLPLIMQRIHRRRDPVQAVRGAGEDGGLFDLLDGGAA